MQTAEGSVGRELHGAALHLARVRRDALDAVEELLGVAAAARVVHRPVRLMDRPRDLNLHLVVGLADRLVDLRAGAEGVFEALVGVFDRAVDRVADVFGRVQNGLDDEEIGRCEDAYRDRQSDDPGGEAPK